MEGEVMTGSCLCKAVTFKTHGEPENVIECFCDHCAKNAGGPAQQVAKFKKTQVEVNSREDVLKSYLLKDTLSGSDKQKVFCGDCGCTLWTIPMRHGGEHFMIRTSLIDHGLELLPPRVVFFASRSLSEYCEQADRVKRYPTMPGL